MTVVAVGRARHEGIAAAIGDYERRAARYWNLDVREIREERGSDSTVVRRREGERLAEAVGQRPFVACYEAGRSYTSVEFAAWMRDSRDFSRDVTFVLGGAFGLDESIAEQAAVRLSLAPWTLPHELARLVLAEQLYRAGTILRGEPYHK
ncbi:MAG TPA: 23S rRNA (pseudouridine(1915)-N(3))-methyltransferase RlmH [Gemmatimonadaceae bacterium]|nr:23S rRNA (pseudouridine(1915)-N(3))-methyltransferase RlmH [Gemmatimonadaceae bacterium]